MVKLVVVSNNTWEKLFLMKIQHKYKSLDKLISDIINGNIKKVAS